MEYINKILPFIEPGIIYGIGTVGLAIIFRYLKFPDFTVLGSIMVGGVVTTFVANLLGCYIGIVMGLMSGALLGFFTGILVTTLNIKPVLAGIISYTASFSIGYLMTEGGTINLTKESFLTPVYDNSDSLLLSFITIAICIVLAFLLNTKGGSLLLAMTAERNFVKYRHRFRNKTFIITILIGNAIVGLSGGLYALDDGAAHVQSHMDFLPFALGAIFAANAITAWAAIFRKDNTLGDGGRLLEPIARIFSVEQDNSNGIFKLLLTYILACIMFTLISRSVQANIFAIVEPSFQYFVVAILMTLFVWWAESSENVDD